MSVCMSVWCDDVPCIDRYCVQRRAAAAEPNTTRIIRRRTLCVCMYVCDMCVCNIACHRAITQSFAHRRRLASQIGPAVDRNRRNNDYKWRRRWRMEPVLLPSNCIYTVYHSAASNHSSSSQWTKCLPCLTAEGPRDALCQLKSREPLQHQHNIGKIAFGMVCSKRMTLKVTQGRRKWRYSIGCMSLPISGLWLHRLYLAPFPRHCYCYGVYCNLE